MQSIAVRLTREDWMFGKLVIATTVMAASHTAVRAQPVAQAASPDGSIVISLDTDNDKRCATGSSGTGSC
jgi:hypothetical protein